MDKRSRFAGNQEIAKDSVAPTRLYRHLLLMAKRIIENENKLIRTTQENYIWKADRSGFEKYYTENQDKTKAKNSKTSH